jgi:hypothetical protein
MTRIIFESIWHQSRIIIIEVLTMVKIHIVAFYTPCDVVDGYKISEGRTVFSYEPLLSAYQTTWCHNPDYVVKFKIILKLRDSKLRDVEFKFLKAVTMKSTVFWIIAPSTSERVRRFEAICDFHLQGRSKKSAEAESKLSGRNISLRFPPVSAGLLFG